MKKNRLALIIVSAIIVCFDILSLLLRKDFNSNFWFGFSFVQLAWVIYILMSLFVNESKEEQRGIKPLEFVNISNIVVMMILAIVFYAIPKVEKITLLIVPYIILYTILIICFVFGFYNKNVIKEQSVPKPIIFDQTDLIELLKSTKNNMSNEKLASSIDEIIVKLETVSLDKEGRVFKSLKEKVVFLHENVRRNQESNLLFYIDEINKVINEII